MTNQTMLLTLLGNRFHGSVSDDFEMLADDAVAWPALCGAAGAIRKARSAYAAGDLDAAADLVLTAQSRVERDEETTRAAAATAERKTFWLIDEDDNNMVIDRDLDLADFFVVNDVSPEDANKIGTLDVGGEARFGGGAAPQMVVRRMA